MPPESRLRLDLFAGILFIAFGAAAVLIARTYPMGGAARMGPGYIPTLLGAVLVVFGLLLAVRAWRTPPEPAGHFAVTALVLTLLAVALFAPLVRPLGLVMTTFLLVIISRLAGGYRAWRETLILCIVLTAIGAGVFVLGLGLPLNLWPERWTS